MMASSTVQKILRQKTVTNYIGQFVFNLCKVSTILGVIMLIVVFPGAMN